MGKWKVMVWGANAPKDPILGEEFASIPDATKAAYTAAFNAAVLNKDHVLPMGGSLEENIGWYVLSSELRLTKWEYVVIRVE